jgi:hypothetical protein
MAVKISMSEFGQKTEENSEIDAQAEDAQAELIRCETVAEMVECCLVMGLSVNLRMELGSETVTIQVSREENALH